MNATLKIKKLHPDAILPQYASAGAACFDLHAVVNPLHVCVLIRGAIVFDTGLAFEVPAGYAMLIFSRSGHGFKNDVRLSNCVGVIDSDYRGEVKVKLIVDSKIGGIEVRNGDRIAQAMLVALPTVEMIVVDELSETARGEGGFGSTGTGIIQDEGDVVDADFAEVSEYVSLASLSIVATPEDRKA